MSSSEEMKGCLSSTDEGHSHDGDSQTIRLRDHTSSTETIVNKWLLVTHYTLSTHSSSGSEDDQKVIALVLRRASSTVLDRWAVPAVKFQRVYRAIFRGREYSAILYEHISDDSSDVDEKAGSQAVVGFYCVVRFQFTLTRISRNWLSCSLMSLR